MNKKAGAIVYVSNTAHTERYAKMLADKLSLPLYELKEAKKKLKKGSEIIYMGWLFASSIKGYGKAKDSNLSEEEWQKQKQEQEQTEREGELNG